MPDVIEVGGLALNGMLLTALISALAGYAALWLWTARARGSRSGPWGDLTAGATAIAVAIWKFGVLIREPSLLWEQPQLLLVIVGSGMEAAAGLAAAAIFWIWLARRNGIGLLSLDALAVSAAGGLLAWNLLSAFEYRWGYAVVCAVLLALLVGKSQPAAARTTAEKAGEDGRAAGTAGEMARDGRIATGTMGELKVKGNFAEGTAGAVTVEGENASGTAGEAPVEESSETGFSDGPTSEKENSAARETAHEGATETAEETAGVSRTKSLSPAGSAAVLAGYVLGAGCLVVSLFAAAPPWVKPPMVAGLTVTQLLFIAVGLAAAALDAYRGKTG